MIMLDPISPSPTKKISPYFSLLIFSIIFGGLAGGVVGYSVITYRPTNSTVTSNTNFASTLSVQEDSATVDVVKQASPAVVSIIVSKDYSQIYEQQQNSPFDNFFGFNLPQQQIPQGQQEIGGGSGFIVSSDGMIVTNKHVVQDTEASYSVVMNNGQKYDAKVLALDPSNDIAVIKIEAKDLPTLKLGNSETVGIGQTVIAIGNALGEYRNTVTKGIISGKARTITAGDNSGQTETLENVFQTDTAINLGNSGGPLIDLSGQVIAMNTAIDQQGQLIGFAIPANLIQKDLTSVIDHGKIVQPFLGVRYTLVTKAKAAADKLPIDYGALIEADTDKNNPAIVADSPAAKAGLMAGDLIAEVNGDKITTEQSLASLLQKYSPGDTITMKIYRKNEATELKATLEERK